MRLAVFHYPIEDWTDAVVMNVLQGLATGIQMSELTRVSYAPLADVSARFLLGKRDMRNSGSRVCERIAATVEGKKSVRGAIDYWKPRVATTFGIAGSRRFDTLRKFGLRHTPNEELLRSGKA